MDKEAILDDFKDKVRHELMCPAKATKILEKILYSFPENEAGVIFSDGEFVPIKDEELMQTIAEWLDREER